MADEKDPVIGGMSLSEYAETGALLRYFERQVLAAIGMPVDRWETARNAWTAAIKKNDGGILQRWHAELDEAWQKVQANRPTLDLLQSGSEAAPEEKPVARELPTYLAQGSKAPVTQQTDPEQPTEGGPRPQAPKPMTATLFADTPTSSRLLPFEESKQPVHSKAAEPIPVPSPQMTGTMTLSAADEEKIRKLTLPFDKTKNAGKTSPGEPGDSNVPAPSLTLEQYVSLRVELSLMPEQRMTTLSRYAIPSESALSSIDAHFASIFSTYPSEKQRFSDLCSQYRLWMTSRR